MERITTSLIIGYDQSGIDQAVLIVGSKQNGTVTIINAFKEKDAIMLYKLLTDEHPNTTALLSILQKEQTKA